MSLLLKILLIAAAIYFMLKWIARLALKRFVKRMEQQREDFFRHHQQMNNNRQSSGHGSDGEVTINEAYRKQRAEKSVGEDEGEYVEYEEVEK
jgi:hypothetical protein